MARRTAWVPPPAPGTAAAPPARLPAAASSSGSCFHSRFATLTGWCFSRSHSRRMGLAVFQMSSSGYSCRAQALDVEHGLLQQDQLRLDARIEAAQGLEQPQQHDGEGDVLQRLVEDGLADAADGAFHVLDADVVRHPAGMHVQLRDAAVVAVEHGDEILGEVVQVALVAASPRCRNPPPRSAARPGCRPARRCCRGACPRGRSCAGTPA